MPWQNQAITAVHALAAGDASGARPKIGAGEWQDCSITMSEGPKMRKTIKMATCGTGAGIGIATGAGAHVTVCAGNAVTVTAVTLVTLVLPLPRYRGISAHAHIDHGLHSRKTGPDRRGWPQVGIERAFWPLAALLSLAAAPLVALTGWLPM